MNREGFRLAIFAYLDKGFPLAQLKSALRDFPPIPDKRYLFGFPYFPYIFPLIMPERLVTALKRKRLLEQATEAEEIHGPSQSLWGVQMQERLSLSAR